MNASDSSETVRLDGEFTHRASELRRLPLPAGSGPLQVAPRVATGIDTSGIELLLLVAREADAAGRSFLLGNPGAPVLAMLTLLGLQESDAGGQLTHRLARQACCLP